MYIKCLSTFICCGWEVFEKIISICRKVVAGVGRRAVMMMTARSKKRATLARAAAMSMSATTPA
jgi:hypothetical protein